MPLECGYRCPGVGVNDMMNTKTCRVPIEVVRSLYIPARICNARSPSAITHLIPSFVVARVATHVTA
jgi:hypothetical protein